MSDTMIDAIEKRLHLPHPIERVWRAVADADEIRQWFPNTSATLEARPGAVGRFVWDVTGDATGDAQHFETEIRVIEVDEPHRFVWSWGHEATTAEPVTTVEFVLAEAEGGGTDLLVRESGFLDEKHRTGNVEGWDSETAELVDYLAREPA